MPATCRNATWSKGMSVVALARTPAKPPTSERRWRSVQLHRTLFRVDAGRARPWPPWTGASSIWVAGSRWSREAVPISGGATALRLAEYGADVVIASRKLENLERVAGELEVLELFAAWTSLLLSLLTGDRAHVLRGTKVHTLAGICSCRRPRGIARSWPSATAQSWPVRRVGRSRAAR